MTERGNDLWQELSALADAFGDLGRVLLNASRQLHNPGVLPPDSIDRELAGLRLAFAGLRDRSCRLAGLLGVSLPGEGDLSSIKELATLLDAVGEAEARRDEQAEVIGRALAVLDRVSRLEHTHDPEYAPLADCRANARALRRSIADGPFEAVAEEASALADRDHPFGYLVTMVEGVEDVSDGLWESLLESVGNAFGRGLAAAVARGKIVERDAPVNPTVEPLITPTTSAAGSVTLIWGEGGPTPWAPSAAEADLYDAAIAPDELLNSVVSESLPFITRRVDAPSPHRRLGRASRHRSVPKVERLETVRLLAADVISEFVYFDANDDSHFDRTETPVAADTVEPSHPVRSTSLK